MSAATHTHTHSLFVLEAFVNDSFGSTCICAVLEKILLKVFVFKMRELLSVIELLLVSLSLMHLKCSFVCSVRWGLRWVKGKSSLAWGRAYLLMEIHFEVEVREKATSFLVLSGLELLSTCTGFYCLLGERWASLPLVGLTRTQVSFLLKDWWLSFCLRMKCFFNCLFCPCLALVSTRKCPVKWDVSIPYTWDFFGSFSSI